MKFKNEATDRRNFFLIDNLVDELGTMVSST